MKNKLTESLLDAITSVMPIVVVIIIISFLINIPNKTIMAFSISSVLLILGIGIFTTGANMAMISIGERIGNLLVKKKNKFINYNKIIILIWRIFISTLTMLILIFIFKKTIGYVLIQDDALVKNLLYILITIFIGVLIYFLMLVITKCEEAYIILKKIMKL